MRFHTRDGTVVLVSPLGDRALMDVTPLTFLSRLVATNQTLRYRNMAEYDIDSIFKG